MYLKFSCIYLFASGLWGAACLHSVLLRPIRVTPGRTETQTFNFSSTALFVCSLLNHIFLQTQRLELLRSLLTICPLVEYNFIINVHFTNNFKHRSMANLWSSLDTLYYSTQTQTFFFLHNQTLLTLWPRMCSFLAKSGKLRWLNLLQLRNCSCYSTFRLLPRGHFLASNRTQKQSFQVFSPLLLVILLTQN